MPHSEGGSPCPVFHGGTARFLEKQLGFRGDQILYFGDHTYGDILRSKKSLGWRTAMVVEELPREAMLEQRPEMEVEPPQHPMVVEEQQEPWQHPETGGESRLD